MTAMHWSDRAACRTVDPEIFFPLSPDESWRDLALCAEVDPDLHFPERGGSNREAKAVCRACDVRADCLAYALEHGERFGVWGGLSEERERQRLRVEFRRQASPICDNGHPRTEANTRNRSDGRIECTDCERDRRVRRKAA